MAGVADQKPLSTRVHLPKFMPFFWLGCAAVAGPWLAANLHLDRWLWGLAALIALTGAIWQGRQRSRLYPEPKLPPLAIICSLCLTAALYQASLPENWPNHISNYISPDAVRLTGVIAAPPELQEGGVSLVVNAQSIVPGTSAAGKAVKGKVLVEVPPGSQYHYGDQLEIRGTLEAPAEALTFSYRSWLAHQGIYAIMPYARVKVSATGQGSPILGLIYSLRERSIEVLDQIFPSPENALLRGILLGDESGIPEGLRQAYSLTGTAHIIAISGFNMAILAGIVTRLLTRRLGARRGGFIAIGVLLVYTILVGASASVVRAAIMATYAILGGLIHRRGNTLNNLGLCVLVMVLINPHIPWDIGFQMSVMATLALALYAQPAQARVENFITDRFGRAAALNVGELVSEYLLMTLIAQALVLPLIIWHFREVSWLFLLANPLVLPAQPLVMILALAALAAGLCAPALGQVLAWLAWPFAAYTNLIVRLLAEAFPTAWTFPRFSGFWLLLYYGLLLLVTLPENRQKLLHSKLQPSWALTGMLSVSLFAGYALQAQPDGLLTLRVLGQADLPPVLISSPQGRYVLIGGAMARNSLSEQVSAAVPLFRRELDALIIPDCSSKTVTGLYGLSASFEIRQVWWACPPADSAGALRLQAAFDSAAIPQGQLRADAGFQLAPDSMLYFQLGENKLLSARLDQQAFHAMLTYPAAEGIDIPPEVNLVVSAQLPDSENWLTPRQADPTVILTAARSSPGVAPTQERWPTLSLEEFHWLEVRTDGTSLWLAGQP